MPRHKAVYRCDFGKIRTQVQNSVSPLEGWSLLLVQNTSFNRAPPPKRFPHPCLMALLVQVCCSEFAKLLRRRQESFSLFFSNNSDIFVQFRGKVFSLALLLPPPPPWYNPLTLLICGGHCSDLTSAPVGFGNIRD